MKISLSCLEALLSREYGSATTTLSTRGEIPSFSTVSILVAGASLSEGTLYVDFLPLGQEHISDSISVVTTEARSQLFKDCNKIVLPNTTDIFTVPGFLLSKINDLISWADAIYRAITQNADLQHIIDLTADLVGQPMYVCDSSWKMLAWWGGEMIHASAVWSYQMKYKYLPLNVMKQIVDAGDLELYQNTPQAFLADLRAGFMYSFISKAIRKDGVYYGNFFIIELYRKLDAYDFEVAEYLGMALSTALSGGRNYIETSALYHSHFIEDVIEGTLTDKTLMRDQLGAMGWKLEGDYILALVDTSKDKRAICNYVRLTLEQDPSVLAIIYNGYVLAVFSEASNRFSEISGRLKSISKNFERTVAVSERFSTFAVIGSYYKQTEFVVKQEASMEKPKKVVHTRDYLLDYLSTVYDGGEIPLTSAIKRLDNYDSEHGTELCLTLYVWLKCQQNTSQTAAKLYIHRNTCINRLETIRGIVQEDFDDYNIRVELLLALHRMGNNPEFFRTHDQ